MESNQTQDKNTLETLRLTAEIILSAKLNNKIKIDRTERMTEAGRRNLLLRCWIDPVAGLPTSFIIKKVAGDYNPESYDSEATKRLFNDWIGTQFLNTVAVEQHSPKFYGGDRSLGLIVIEDVQHRNSLVEPLLGNDPDRAAWALLQYATCLAQLHRDTVGKIKEYERLYRTLAPKIEFTRANLNVRQLQSKLNSLSLELNERSQRDIETINNMLASPGELLTYIHTDACPDNVLDTGTRLRLIDFETGRFNHALIDAACGRMMFPSCWCSKALPLDLVEKMESIYRAILSQACPSLEDDLVFETALVNACGMWLLYTILRHLEPALVEEQDFGISTVRQRILARLVTFIDLSTELSLLPDLCSVAERLLDLLDKRWSDVPKLPLYPAFT